MSRFGTVLGLYEDDEIDSELFHGSLQDWEPDTNKAAFWEEITVPGRIWDSRRAKATWILDPLHRVIERAIFHVIGGRGDSTGNITTRDLFHLCCIISGSNYNLAVSVAESIFRGVGSTPTSRICGGAFATRLAKFHRVRLDHLTEACDYGLLDLQQLNSMHLTRKVNGIPKLVDRMGRIWDPLPVVEEGDDGDDGDGGDGGDHDVHMHDIPVQGQVGGAGGADSHMQIGQVVHGFDSPNWENVYSGFGGGGYDHGGYGTYGPSEPSSMDLGRRMDGLALDQEEVRRDVGLIRAEQHRQGNFLEELHE
ncbi:hypothetical protein HanIR_Chr07g0306291 [Helianthus annuus]|nr:hypothetical protein HanIR_Chr07g0306291 [Helianthus annuus]